MIDVKKNTQVFSSKYVQFSAVNLRLMFPSKHRSLEFATPALTLFLNKNKLKAEGNKNKQNI